MLQAGIKQTSLVEDEVGDAFLGGATYDEVTEPVHGVIAKKDAAIFNRKLWMTFGDGDGYQGYYRRQHVLKQTIHWGQLKLLLTEVQFLTLFWDPAKVPKPVIVYVGAADGQHIPLLANMFPEATFELYDPSNFHKNVTSYDSERIHIHQQMFDDSTCDLWKNRSDVFFICDIRDRSYDVTGKGSDRDNEKIAWDNMLQQQKWVEIIKPHRAQLKFRLPYTYDFVLKEGETRSYLNGIIFRQPWTPQGSTETRLVIGRPNLDGIYPKRDWNLTTYQSLCFYHNAYVREEMIFFNPIDGKNRSVGSLLGLSQNYDSILTLQILKDYLERWVTIEITNSHVLKLVEEIFTYLESSIKKKTDSLQKILK